MNNVGLLALYVVGFIAIFYFLAIRPQQRQRKAQAEMLSSIKKGDRVVTIGGLFGTVKRVEETLVVVEIAKGVTVKMARKAIAEVIRDKERASIAAPEPVKRGKAEPVEDEEEIEETAAEEGAEAEEATAEENAGAESPKS